PFARFLSAKTNNRKTVSTPSSLHGELAQVMRHALLPQRFPFRRDIELYGGLIAAGKSVVFYDHFWVEKSVLAACVVAVAGEGLEAAMKAASLRELLRASLLLTKTPKDAIALCNEACGPDEADLAIAM